MRAPDLSLTSPSDGARGPDSSNLRGAPGKAARAKRRRWPLWILIFAGIVGVGCWTARSLLVARVESNLVHRLAERGIFLQYGGRSFSPWHGLRLENVVLHRDARRNHPVVEISALHLSVPLGEVFRIRSLVSYWDTKDATLTLHDDAGPLVFERVTTHMVLRSGQLEIPRLETHSRALAFALSGKILLEPDSEEQPAEPGPFVVELSTVRAVQAVLDFEPGHQPFTIRGTYTLDLRQDDIPWKADLTGTGQAVEWQGIPLRDADVRAQLSSTGMNLSARLQLTAGSANVSVSRRDWDTAPRVITGSLTDAGGKSDEFSATYEGASETLTVSSLSGKANLWEFSRNFPILSPYFPASVQFQKFPDLAVKDFSWSFAETKTAPAWKVGSIQTRSPAYVTLLLEDGPLKIEGLEGLAAFVENSWKFQLKSGGMTWHDLSARETHVDATLGSPRLKATMSLRLASGSAALAFSSEDWRRAPLQFTGSLTDAHGQADRISGNYQRAPAALHITQLAGKANLLEFAANIPGLTARFPQSVRVRTFPEIAVKDFTYHPGKSPTVGSLRLVSPADVTATIKGHPVAIDHLVGQVAFDGRVWQLSQVSGRLFDGQFAVDGAYDDGTLHHATVTAGNLHLAQLKPWLGESQGSLGEAILAVDYRGAIGADPSQLTGAGSIRLENAPLVKVPLLDQTYALFSVLSSPLQRRGTGRLNATFSANKGIATISQFTASSDALKVTATGTLDLNKREVAARARGNFRSVVGLATSLLSRALAMQVSGTLDNIRVRPVGWEGMVSGTVEGTSALVPNTVKQASKLTGNIVRDGVALPLRAFDLFKPEAPPAKP